MSAELVRFGRSALKPKKPRNSEARKDLGDLEKYLSTTEALQVAEHLGVSVTLPTMISWCRKFGIGHQLGGQHGHWMVRRGKLEEFLAGDIPAAE